MPKSFVTSGKLLPLPRSQASRKLRVHPPLSPTDLQTEDRMKKTTDSIEEVAADKPGGQDSSRKYVLQIDRLCVRGKRQLSQILASGDMDQLERCVASLQLALTYVEALPIQDRAPSLRKIADCLVQAFAAGKNDPRAPIQSDQPLVFVISYPRSGNTALIQTVATSRRTEAWR